MGESGAALLLHNNPMDNYIAIGDIHGRYDLLQDLLHRVRFHLDDHKFYADHKFVFLGDMVDRGPQSFDVVTKIKELCDTGQAIALLGNHEDLMLDYARDGIFQKHSIWTMNGGHHTMRSYCAEFGLYGAGHFFEAFKRSGHDAWLRSLPYFYETDKVWFSHAPIGKPQYRKRKEGDFRADKEALTWTCHRDYDVSEEGFALDHGKLAVCGHVHALENTPAQSILEPRVYPNVIYGDTGSGCAPWGRLTATIITDGEYETFIQAAPNWKLNGL